MPVFHSLPFRAVTSVSLPKLTLTPIRLAGLTSVTGVFPFPRLPQASCRSASKGIAFFNPPVLLEVFAFSPRRFRLYSFLCSSNEFSSLKLGTDIVRPRSSCLSLAGALRSFSPPSFLFLSCHSNATVLSFLLPCRTSRFGDVTIPRMSLGFVPFFRLPQRPPLVLNSSFFPSFFFLRFSPKRRLSTVCQILRRPPNYSPTQSFSRLLWCLRLLDHVRLFSFFCEPRQRIR